MLVSIVKSSLQALFYDVPRFSVFETRLYAVPSGLQSWGGAFQAAGCCLDAIGASRKFFLIQSQFLVYWMLLSPPILTFAEGQSPF